MISIRELCDCRLVWYRSVWGGETYRLGPEGLPGETAAVFRDRGSIKLPTPPKRNLLWTVLESLGYEALYGADAETADGIWQFLRRQSSVPSVTVRLPGDPPNIAEFKSDCLELPQGRSVRRLQRHFPHKWRWHDHDDRPVMRLRPRIWGLWSPPGIKAYVEFEPAAKDCAELPLLVLVSWYDYLTWRQSSAD
jgi:hypothetical protein